MLIHRATFEQNMHLLFLLVQIFATLLTVIAVAALASPRIIPPRQSTRKIDNDRPPKTAKHPEARYKKDTCITCKKARSGSADRLAVLNYSLRWE